MKKVLFAHNSMPLANEHEHELMSVKEIATQNSAPLANELPTLLLSRHKRKCKTSHGKGKPALDRQSTAQSLDSEISGEVSFKACKSLGSAMSFKACKSRGSAETRSSEHEMSSGLDTCQKAFPSKVAPVTRWRAAAKIQSYLSKWRKGKVLSVSTESEFKGPRQQAEIAECLSPQPWPEEPDAPTREDLEALAELESMLIEHYGTMAAAHKFISNSIKNPCSSECKEPRVCQRKLRIALHSKAPKEATLQGSPGYDRLDQMFDRLLTLLRKRGGDISKGEFLRFPELLAREMALQDANEDPLLGSRLRERLIGPIDSPEEVLELLQKAAVALLLEPSRTTNLLFQIASAPCSSCGLTSAISNIMRIAQQFGAPVPGVKLSVLLAGWTVCDALAKQVIALGAPLPPTPPSQKTSKPPLNSKIKTPNRRFSCKVDVSPMDDQQCQNYENECNTAFWQGLSTGEVLWNVGCGAEALNDEDFKTLLRAAWGLFDEFDAVVCLLGPVGWGRLRPKLDALAELNLQQHVQGKDSENAGFHLQTAGVLLQQIASMCVADPRLARIAALYGASFVAYRIPSTANTVNFADRAVGSAAAQVNRSVAAVAEELILHVEELLGGRQVACCLSSGHYNIVPAAPAVSNPLATYHQNVTAQVLANATAKTLKGDATADTPKGDALRCNSEERNKLSSVEKYLLGYSNLQGL